MPVVYDVQFKTINGQTAVYMPMSDWTFAWEFENNIPTQEVSWLISQVLKYDRQVTKNEVPQLYDTYISNVTRILFDPDPGLPNRSYCVGGSLYYLSDQIGSNDEDQLAGFYERNTDGSGNVSTMRRTNGSFLLRTATHRAIVDAAIIPGTPTIVVLVGKTSGSSTPNGTDLGVFYSLNRGLTWGASDFTEPSQDPNVSTEDAYNNSLVPSLVQPNGLVEDIFDSYFSLCYAGGTRVYLWLREQSGQHLTTGGMFFSNNSGVNWTRLNQANFPIAPFYYYASLKWLGGNRIAIAMRDNGASSPAGLYVGTIGGTGEITWDYGRNSVATFKHATHIDYDPQTNLYAAFGKKGSDNYSNIYTCVPRVGYPDDINDATKWRRVPRDPVSAPLPLFPLVRSLTIESGTNKLWISTGGQGVFIYKSLQSTLNAEPWIISTEVIVDYPMYNDRDIYVIDGGHLIIQGTADNHVPFDMAENRTIYVEEGGQLTASFADFNCPIGGGELWQGIYLTNSLSASITNCNFRNTQNCLTIYNPNPYYSAYRKFIGWNNFYVPAGGSSPRAIYAGEVSDLVIDGNVFDLTANAGAAAIEVENTYSPPGGAGGEAPHPSLAIQYNAFSGGTMHVNLNCMTAGLTNFFIYKNTFSGSADGSAVGVWARKISGQFKNNSFSSEKYSIPAMFSECELNLFGNKLQGTLNSDLDLQINTTARLAPIINEYGQNIWYGGMNNIKMLNATGIQSRNITFTEGCTLFGDKGSNCFILQSPQDNFHIQGALPQPCSDQGYDITRNSWNNGPFFDITCGGNPVTVNYDPTIICPVEEDLYGITIGYQITDLGNGIFDTTLITTPPSGGGMAFIGNEDRLLYYQILNKKRLRDYAGSIIDAKNMIDNHDSSKYFLPSLDQLYQNYKYSDSVRNQNVTTALFGSLKSYIEQKMQQYSGRHSFVEKAYNYFLMCLVKMRNYPQAIAGYENIMNNHPDPLVRLTASWDRAAAILLMNHGGGGMKLNDPEERDELLDKNPAHKIAMDVFQTSKELAVKDDKYYKSRGYDRHKVSVIESRVQMFNPKNRVEFNKKVDEDLRILLGLGKGTNTTQNNNLPRQFRLYQNYPNPFNPVTTIKYDIPKDANVTIRIYDILGREVTSLVNNELKKAGRYDIRWNAFNYASGVYFYRIEAGSFVDAKKMVLLK